MVFVVQATTPRASGVCPTRPCPVDKLRLYIHSNVVLRARSGGHVDNFVLNIAKISVQDVLWRVLLFQSWCNFTTVTTSSTMG